MTRLLDKAFQEAAKLPEAEQDAIARAILEEVAGDEEWDARFAQSAETLGGLADDALAEHRRGATRPLDPDAL